MQFRRSWCTIVSMTGMFAVAAGCAREAGEGTGATAASQTTGATTEASAVQVPPAPTFGAPDTAQRPGVLEYARRVQFIDNPQVSDEQTLVQPRGRGPRARIEPVAYAHRLTRERLARGAVIARIVSDGDYAPLGLSRGINYFFVDSGTAGWRSIIISDVAARPARVMQVVLSELQHPFSVPSARWIESAGFIYPNPDCGRICCIPCMPPAYPCLRPQGPPRLNQNGVLEGIAEPQTSTPATTPPPRD